MIHFHKSRPESAAKPSCNDVSLVLLCAAVKKPAPPQSAPEGCQQPLICPLSHIRAGTSVRIKKLPASSEVTHRLREMGFCEERKIRLLSSNANVICQVCNARLGISEDLAENILVESLPHQHKVA